MRKSLIAFGLLAALSVSMAGPAQSALPKSKADDHLTSIDVKQRLGQPLPLDAKFTTSEGKSVLLGDVFGNKPAVVALVYYDCPMLCSLVLEGLVKALRPVSLDVGKDFDVVVVSFDPGERPQDAAKVKERYINSYKREGSEDGWHFLVGNDQSIEAITEAIGFEYSYDERRDEYAHAASIVIATPEGKLSRYYFGIEYSPRDLRLGLIESASEKIGTAIDQLLLYCYHYDPDAGQYTAMALGLMRMGGAATVTAMLGGFVLAIRREKKSC